MSLCILSLTAEEKPAMQSLFVKAPEGRESLWTPIARKVMRIVLRQAEKRTAFRKANFDALL